MISLCKFTNISVSDDGKTADIGTGLRWLDVYAELEKHHMTVTGGRVPSVGVGGLLLGGGLSFQNSEHGLSCIGVEEYEVSSALTNPEAPKHFISLHPSRLSLRIRRLSKQMPTRIRICSGL